ncbi:helix-turn-helix domain-containing protein [Methylolobus aquaticus]
MRTHYKHLTMDERHTINGRRLHCASLGAVARELKRPASTVAREVARNQPAVSYGAVPVDGGSRLVRVQAA